LSPSNQLFAIIVMIMCELNDQFLNNFTILEFGAMIMSGFDNDDLSVTTLVNGDVIISCCLTVVDNVKTTTAKSCCYFGGFLKITNSMH
jgi:hypothetical protein